MNLKKIAIGLVIAYASVVILFESLLGFYQPQNEATLTITTTNDAGEQNDRVLSRIIANERLYVAAIIGPVLGIVKPGKSEGHGDPRWRDQGVYCGCCRGQRTRTGR